MEESNEKKIPKYVIKPRFSFIYELIMPTGRKIKKSLFISLGMIVLYLIFNICANYIDLSNLFNGIDINFILSMIFLVLFIVFFIKLVIHIAFQVLQYKHLSFSFFDDYMVYEDSFLNQHRKTIQYSNIKEVEIRRTVADRILGYGIIVIYTNAENSNNGLVIYSIRNPQECYDKIQKLLEESRNKKSSNKIENTNNEEKVEDVDKEANEVSKIVNLSVEDEEKFNESLKNINDD